MTPEASWHRKRIGRLLISGRLPFDYIPEKRMDIVEMCRRCGDGISNEAADTIVKLRRELADAINHYEGKMEELTRFRDEWERVAEQTRAVFGDVTACAGILLGNLDVLLEDRAVCMDLGTRKAVLQNNMRKLTEAIEGAHVDEVKVGGK